jgi:hypothetical protein
MATINLGNIKFKWQGTYSGATAYTVDDVVYYNGSAYICILASTGNLPTNTTYWEVMAEGGDVANVLTTQGDVLYRDGSGLQRLAAGTSGQVLQTNGTGANPSWADAGSGSILQVVTAQDSARDYQIGNNSSFSSPNVTGLSLTITPTSTSSKILLSANFTANNVTATTSNGSDYNAAYTWFRGGTNLGTAGAGLLHDYTGAGSFGRVVCLQYVDEPNTTSAITYGVAIKVVSGQWAVSPYSYGIASGSANYNTHMCYAMEIAV